MWRIERGAKANTDTNQYFDFMTGTQNTRNNSNTIDPCSNSGQRLIFVGDSGEMDVGIGTITLNRDDGQIAAKIPGIAPGDRQAVSEAGQRRVCAEVLQIIQTLPLQRTQGQRQSRCTDKLLYTRLSCQNLRADG